MTLMTGWESLRELSAMQDRMNRMNRLIRESYSPEVPEEALTTTTLAPPVDIYEDEHNITLRLEVPGIDEKDIDVLIENTTLTVHARQRTSLSRPHSPALRLSEDREIQWFGESRGRRKLHLPSPLTYES